MKTKLNRTQLTLCLAFGLVAILGCAAIISFGVRMDQAGKEREARMARPWSSPEA
ncbi:MULTISPECIES: hypothetical protein [Brevundimonas]|uniref:Uncharacterized protein n=1 Tax=Brevundimonas pondensis TaxID=2774189 RepID=A0ABX7SFP5_9CAUL|nr:hypothetical protein [Brevundimonas pondensis]QTC86347.1 hypothetical protein IFE19_09175 [Brevundimonas pondensis]